MHQAYRPVPRESPIVEVGAWTAPLGIGRPVAFGLLLLGLAGALRTWATTLACVHRAGIPACDLIIHRPLFVTRRPIDLRGLRGVSTTTDPDLPLGRAVALHARASEGSYLPLPTRGIYRDPDGVWRHDGALFETARGFFQGRRGAFEVRQVSLGRDSPLASAWLLLGPLGAMAAVLWAERKTRRLDLWVDPNLRIARSRSVGFGGPSLTREVAFGAHVWLQRSDAPGPPHLPMVRVVGEGGASLPIFTGHAVEHGPTLDGLIARAHQALSRGASSRGGSRAGSSSGVRRLGPSGLLVAAAAGLGAWVVGGLAGLPDTEGTVEVVSSITRCDSEGMTFLRGARMSWTAPVGSATTRLFTVPPGAPRRVRFFVAPGRTTTFDCARIVAEPGVRELRAMP